MVDAVGAESITGGGNDKKCDLFYFDKEEGRCVIAQCYTAQSKKPAAPANRDSSQLQLSQPPAAAFTPRL